MKLLQELVYFLTIRPKIKKLKKLLPEAEIYPTGSRYVCNPPVLSTDIDFLVYDELNIDLELARAGYMITSLVDYIGSGINGSADWPFTCWRKGRLNLIVTPSRRFADRHVMATFICKEYNVRDKIARVFIHEVLRGNANPQDYKIVFNNKELPALLLKFTGPNGPTMIEVFRAQKGLIKSCLSG